MTPRWRISAAVAGAIVGVLLVLWGPSAAAGNGGSNRGPYEIESASLTQNGQQLVWRAQLAQPSSTAGLVHGHRSLCLLIERVRGGTVVGQLCVGAAERRSHVLRLTYSKVTGSTVGPEQVVSANVSMTSASGLFASFLPAAIDRPYRAMRWQVISTLRSAACASSAAARRCSELYPAKPTLLRLHTPVLVGCVPSGPSVAYDGSPTRPEIALTFDDGPWNDPPTAHFLAVLEREHVPATFFEIGDQIGTYDPRGVVERRMLADGDMIGDHSWSHPDVAKLRARKQRAQLLDTAAAIRRATGGFTPCLWRPPYGAITPSLISLARSLGFLTIMWDVDPRDWTLRGAGAIYSNVVSHAHNGAIVVQHFGGGPRFQTLAALPREIEALRAKGYQFVTVTQLLGLRLLYQ